MFASITCPTCRHKFSVPEGVMGNRQTCPNCHSPFVAGKSVAEADAPIKFQAAEAPPINKTMLGETEPPVRYNCPRCKKPLESPAIESGTKKPCPACGQRLQVPAPPAPARPQPNLNKTILAFDESNPQAPRNVGAQGSPVVSQAPAGAAPGPNMKWLSDYARTHPLAAVAGGAVLFMFLLIIYSLITGGKKDEQALANAQKEVEKLRAEMDQYKRIMDQQKQLEAEQRSKWEMQAAEQKAQQRALDQQRDLDRQNLAYQNNQKLAQDAKDRLDEKQRQLDQASKDAADKQSQFQAQLKSQMDAIQRQQETANQRANTIINTPPPVYYPWHPRYYWGW
jgi:hypothetical protein